MPTTSDISSTLSGIESLDFRAGTIVLHPEDWESVASSLLRASFAPTESEPPRVTPWGTHVGFLWGANLYTSTEVEVGRIIVLPEAEFLQVPFGAWPISSRYLDSVGYHYEPLIDRSADEHLGLWAVRRMREVRRVGAQGATEPTEPTLPCPAQEYGPKQEGPTVWDHLLEE